MRILLLLIPLLFLGCGDREHTDYYTCESGWLGHTTYNTYYEEWDKSISNNSHCRAFGEVNATK